MTRTEKETPMTGLPCPTCGSEEDYSPQRDVRCGICGHQNPPSEWPLLLTAQEWDDLTVILIRYRDDWAWVDDWAWADDPDDERTRAFYVEPVRRKRALAQRIIEANQ